MEENIKLFEYLTKDGFITPERLEMLVEEVLKSKNFNSLSLPGLSEERKYVFVPGLAILCGVFDALGIKELRLSDGALREGVLYEMEGRFRHRHFQFGVFSPFPQGVRPPGFPAEGVRRV